MNKAGKTPLNQQNTSLETENVTFVNFKDKDKNLTNLQLIGGGNPPTGNWLLDMPDGTTFVVNDKIEQNNFTVLILQIKLRTEKFVRLWNVNTDSLFSDVDPTRFIKRFNRLEILEEEKETPTEE